MKKLSTIFTVMIAGVFAPAFYASSLQDWEFNVNGTTYFPTKGSGETLASIPTLTQTGFNATTGLGTYQIKVTSVGASYAAAFFDIPASIPFYNEFGVVNGTAVSGETYQIDVPEYDVGTGTPNHGLGTIVDNVASETLSDTNSVPGTTSNYANTCGASGGGSVTASCNDFVSLALGFGFTPLKAGQTETIDFTLSTTNPGGFSVEEIHPIDGSNTSALDVYLSGSAVLGNSGPPPPPPSGAPEPASAGLAAAAVGVLAFAKMRLSRKDGSK